VCSGRKDRQAPLIVSIYCMGICLLTVSGSAIQATVLEELLLSSASLEYDMSETLQIVLSKLKDTEARTNTHILYNCVLSNDTYIKTH
jgi:hypothetical protein